MQVALEYVGGEGVGQVEGETDFLVGISGVAGVLQLGFFQLKLVF